MQALPAIPEPTMPNLAISRDEVHRLAEGCSDEGDAFQSTASRLIREQRRLSRFFEQNAEPMGPMAGQVALYMLSVSIRIFELIGGRLAKVNGTDLADASARVQAAVRSAELLPAGDDFAERAKSVGWRAQPHLLDEVLWALFERDEEKKEGEVDIEPDQSALVYIMLWVAIEALDRNWRPPASWGPDDPRT